MQCAYTSSVDGKRGRLMAAGTAIKEMRRAKTYRPDTAKATAPIAAERVIVSK